MVIKMGEAFEIMKRAGIFMILAQTVIYFRPNESYEKYLKLLVHVMLLPILFFPVVGLFRADAGKRVEDSLSFYNSRVEEILYGDAAETQPAEEVYLSTLEQEIKTKLNNYKRETGYTVKTAQISGFTQEKGGEAEKDIQLLLFVIPYSDNVCTVRVDNIKWGDSTPDDRGESKSTSEARALSPEALSARYAQYLGMNREQVEVMADGMD